MTRCTDNAVSDTRSVTSSSTPSSTDHAPTQATTQSTDTARAPWWRRLLGSPSGAIGAVLLIAVIGMAVSASWLFPQDPLDLVSDPFLRPGQDSAYPLGTDMLGRDILSGIFHGARSSLFIAATSTVIALLLGVGGGLASGYRGGLTDQIISRITVFFQTVPPFLFALAIVAIVQPTVITISLAIGLTSWPNLARLVRAETQKLRNSEMVLASIALGASDLRIVLRDILPNTLTPILVSTSLLVAAAILTESALAFLGLGDPNVASWGNMVGSGREVLRTDWYIATLPGIAIVITVLALNLLSDGLAEALDPRAEH